MNDLWLISSKQIARVDLIFYIIQTRVISVGNDCLALFLECPKIIDNSTPEEGVTIGQGWLINNHLRAFGLDALHDALDGALPEVVAVRLHRQAVHTHNGRCCDRIVVAAKFVAFTVTVPPGFAQHGVGNVILARAVALHDGRHHVLRHVAVVGQQLLGVLRKAVAAIAEGGVVVVGADAGVEAHALDDGAAVEALDLGVGVQLVEVAHAQGEVGVGKEFHSLGFLHAHEQGVDVGLQRAFLQQGGEGAGELFCLGVADGLDGGVLFVELLTLDEFGVAHDDAAGIEVVVEGLALAQEFGGEEEVEVAAFEFGLEEELQGVLLVERTGVAHGDGALDDHHGLGVDLQHEVDDFFHVRGVEVVLHRVVVGGCGDDDEVGIAVGGAPVERGGEVERFFGQVFLNILVLNGRNAVVNLLYLFGHHVDGGDLVVLCQQGGNAQADIAGTGYGHLEVLKFTHGNGWFVWLACGEGHERLPPNGNQ